MVNAMGALATWGLGIWLSFGFFFLCSDDSSKYRGRFGLISMVGMIMAIVGSVIREALLS